MNYREVVMYMEIGGFVSCLCGWVLVCSTLPTEYWTFSEVGSIVLTTANYYSNLWRDCVSDTTGVSDCKDYPSMLALPAFLHGCRALAVCSVITGFFGAVLTLVGMKCTKIGGSEIANARVTFAGGVTYLVSGLCGMVTYSWWANKVISEFLDVNFKEQKFELGAAVFIGWGGSVLLLSGGTVLTYFSAKEGLPKISGARPQRPATYATARTARTYRRPDSSSRVTWGPPLFYEDGRSREAMKTFNMDSFV
ncbi:claudin-10-like [Pungitius pungitius]|uniref:claudin-10-like n=1 Tax=Pungitius pungitius TaxID=134920 RepID=UPI002E0E9203